MRFPWARTRTNSLLKGRYFRCCEISRLGLAERDDLSIQSVQFGHCESWKFQQSCSMFFGESNSGSKRTGQFATAGNAGSFVDEEDRDGGKTADVLFAAGEADDASAVGEEDGGFVGTVCAGLDVELVEPSSAFAH